YSSTLAILIACLGLLGLAAFAAEQRTKEIGVRKVLGASVSQIVLLLSRDFAKLVGLAFVVAAPVAYFAMNRWLQNFAYRAEISLGTFLWAGLTVSGLACLTVSWQAIKAALANPIEALRYE
ncbi:MAG: ABC transporter permease, partial [bacterium]